MTILVPSVELSASWRVEFVQETGIYFAVTGKTISTAFLLERIFLETIRLLSTEAFVLIVRVTIIFAHDVLCYESY